MYIPLEPRPPRRRRPALLGPAIALVVLEAAGCYALWNAPAPITLERFDTDYRGQTWISVTGRLAVEIADRGWVDTEENVHIANAAAAEVPIMPEVDRPTDPIRVVLYTKIMPEEELDGYLAARAAGGTQTIVGRAVLISGVHRAAATLGGRTLAPRAIFLYEDAWHERLRMAVAVACFALGAVSLVLVAQAAMRRRADGAGPTGLPPPCEA